MCNQNCAQGRACQCSKGREPLTRREQLLLVAIYAASAGSVIIGLVWLVSGVRP